MTDAYTAPAPFQVRWTTLPGAFTRQYPGYFWSPLPYHVLAGQSATELPTAALGAPRSAGGHSASSSGYLVTTSRLSAILTISGPAIPSSIVSSSAFCPRAARRCAWPCCAARYRWPAAWRPPSRAIRSETIAADAGPRILTSDSVAWEHLDFNLQPSDDSYPFFADKNVRQAVSYALDRQRMIDTLFGGYGTVPDEYIPSAHWAYTSTVHTYPYSPTLAAGLLAAAGWTDSDADGIIDKAGVPFTFTHSTTDRLSRQTLSYIMQENLAAVGISVTLNFMTGRGLFNSCSQGGPLYCRTYDTAEFSGWAAVSQVVSSTRPARSRPPPTTGRARIQPLLPATRPTNTACMAAMHCALRKRHRCPYHQQAIVMLAGIVPVLPLSSRPPSCSRTRRSIRGSRSIRSSMSSGTATPGHYDPRHGYSVCRRCVDGQRRRLHGDRPGGVFAESAVVTYTPRYLVVPGGGLVSPNRAYNLEAVATAGGAPLQALLPYTVSVSYTDAQLAAASIGDESAPGALLLERLGLGDRAIEQRRRRQYRHGASQPPLDLADRRAAADADAHSDGNRDADGHADGDACGLRLRDRSPTAGVRGARRALQRRERRRLDGQHRLARHDHSLLVGWCGMQRWARDAALPRRQRAYRRHAACSSATSAS